MMVIHQELLPDSYLLVLAPGADTAETNLAQGLRCARHSGKPAVWVDCGLLTSLSTKAAQLLWTSYHRLWAIQVHLVLVHVPEQVQEEQFAHQPGPYIVSTLLDAARQPSGFSLTAAQGKVDSLRVAW